MKLHKISSLDSSQIQQIQTMVNTCTGHDKTSLSFPFDEAELFLFIEEGRAVISSIAFVPVDENLYECSAFTHPDFRGQGLFTDLLDAGIESLPEDSELLFYTDRNDENTAAVLESIGAELDSEEHMMALKPEDFFAVFRPAGLPQTSTVSSASGIDIHLESLDIDGTPTLRFHSDHAVINFSVFPSHFYLYGFEVEETRRGMGYGTKFLDEVLAQLLVEKSGDDPAYSPVGSTCAGSRSADSAAADMGPRPVLLQVAGSNTPALALYKKTGFRITETLCCYLY